MAVMTVTSFVPWEAILILRGIAAGHPVTVRHGRRRRNAEQNGQPVSVKDVDFVLCAI